MIEFSEFRRLLTDTTECTDLDSYIAEVGGSVPLDNVDAVVRLLSAIWTMGKDGLTIRSVAAASDISLRQLAMTYGLPYRTVQDWAAGVRTPPEWQLPLIAYAVLSDCMGEWQGNHIV